MGRGRTTIQRLHGEVLETGQKVGVDIYRTRGGRRERRERAGMIDFLNMERLELSTLEQRVVYSIMAQVPPLGGRLAYCTMQDIAERLETRQPSIARAMKGLKDRRIVWSERQGRWLVNAWLMFNGSFDDWGAAMEQDPEPIWSRNVDPETGEVR